MFRARVLCIVLLFAILGVRVFADDPPLATGRITVFGSKIVISPSPVIETPEGVPVFINTTGTGIHGTVVGELRGPGISGSLSFQTEPGKPFELPPLNTKGTYFFENIRLMNNGQFVMAATPDHVEIHVIEVLITQISSRPLSLQEIRSLGIVINENDFSAVSFEVGLSFSSHPIRINFPLLLPKRGDLRPLIPPPLNNVAFSGPVVSSGTQGPLPPNLPSFVPFTFKSDGPEFGLDLPDIPGVIVFPNEIAFLNQFFAVVLMVRNGASDGTSLSVDNLTAQSVLDPNDMKLVRTNPVVPLGSPVPIRLPGSDGLVGTADDVDLILAGQTAQSEFFVEGLTEGTHTVRMNLHGTLHGLVQGDVPVSGTATGAILVRNPNFAITFSHPAVVQSGQPYDLFITITNTSPVDANLVRLTIPTNALVNCIILGNSYKDFDSIKPGESATASFKVEPHVTGQVTAAVLTSTGNVTGQFQFRVAVGERGIPLSPNSLILPEYTKLLGPDFMEKGLNILGLAYSAATAPPGGLPPGAPHISKSAVFQRAVEMAQAGQRFQLGESKTDSLSQLLLDWLGNSVPDDDFDLLRRTTEKGRAFSDFIFSTMHVGSSTAMQFHHDFGDTTASRNPYLSVMLKSTGPLPAFTVTDSENRSISPTGGEFEPSLNIPYSDVLRTDDGSVAWALIGNLPTQDRTYTMRIVGNNQTEDIALMISSGDHLYRVEYDSFTAIQGTLYQASIDVDHVDASTMGITDALGNVLVARVTEVNKPLFQILGAVQDAKADKTGHLVALLFNQPVTAEAAETLTNYSLRSNSVVNAKLQMGGRIVYLAFRNPISPLVNNDLTVFNLDPVAANHHTIRIDTTVSTNAGTVSGRVLGPDGQPLPLAPVQLKEYDNDDLFGELTFHVTAETTTNSQGEYSFDYVRSTGHTFQVLAQDPFTGYLGDATSIVSQPNQLVHLDIIMLGRGTVRGQVYKVAGANHVPVAGAVVSGTSLTEAGSRSVLSDAQGNYVIEGLAVGNINLAAQNQDVGDPNPIFGAASTSIPYSGSVVTKDIEVTQQSAGRVIGRVLQSNATDPIVDAYVVLSVPVGGDTLRLVAFSDENGNFSFDQVPAGQVSVTATDRNTGRLIGAVTITLNAGSEVQISIVSQGNGNIEVVLSLAGGMRLQDVVVWVEGTAQIKDPATSQTVLFQGIPVGRWTVKANNRATGALISGVAVIPYASATGSVLLSFPEKGGVHGVITQANGDPAANSTVLIFSGLLQNHLVDVTTADASGRYAFTGLEYDSYTVHAISQDQNDGGSSQKVTISGINSNAVANVTFLGKGDINVHVHTLAAAVVAPVKLETVSFDYDGRIRRSLVITKQSDTSGNVTFTNIFRGGFRVIVSTPFTATSIVNGNLNGPQTNVDVLLSDFPSIAGVVHDADGKLVTEQPASVTLTYPFQPQTPPQTVTAFEGHFTFTNVPPGIAYFLASQGGTKGALSVITQQTNPDIDIHLLGSGSVFGMIKDAAGNPVAGANVRLQAGGLLPQTLNQQSDSNGKYRFDNVTEGPVSIDASNGVSGGRGVTTIIHHAEVSLDITLAAVGTIQGVVYNQNHSTAANVDVVLQSGGTTVGQFTSDANGGFSFENAPLGSYNLAALDKSSGRRAGAGQISLTSNHQIVQRDLTLEGVGAVSGIVYDSTGSTPIAGARITLRSAGVIVRDLLGSSGADGSFSFAAVPTGPFTITAQSDLLSGQTDGSVSQDDQIVNVNVLLQQSGDIDGAVIFNNGSALPQEAVPIISLNGHGISMRIDAPAGIFHVQNLPFGTYTLSTRFTYPNSNGVLTPYRGIATVALSTTGSTQALLRLMGLKTVEVHIDGELLPITTVTLNYHNQMEASTSVTYLADRMNTTSFPFVPESNYSVMVRTEDFVHNAILSGSVSGVLTGDGGTLVRTVTLQASGDVTGTVTDPSGTLAQGVAIQLASGGLTLFTQSDGIGGFRIDGVPASDVPYTLTAEDFVHGGKARARAVMVESHTNNHPLQLDNVRPTVLSVAPAQGSNGVPFDTQIHVVFSEAMDDAALRQAFRLLTSSGPVGGTLAINGAEAVFTPNAPLDVQRTYTISVAASAEDVAGNTLAAPFISTFTTLDNIPPRLTTSVPLNLAFNVPADTTLTLFFSEPIANTAIAGDDLVYSIRKSSPPSVVVITNRTWNNTKTSVVLHFSEQIGANKHVVAEISNYKDAAGNIGQPVTISFDTIDTIAPSEPVLTASANPIREGTPVTVTAATEETLINVDFYINGALKFHDTVAPFVYNVPASLTTIAANGGDRMVVDAIAVDRSGNSSCPNRQGCPTPFPIRLIEDTPPQILSLTGVPAPGGVHPGGTITVQYEAADDGSIRQALIIVTGAVNQTVPASISPCPTGTCGSEQVVLPFSLPIDSLVFIKLRLTDDASHNTDSTPLTYTITTDATPPTVSLTLPSPILVGQTILLRASATDNVAVSKVEFYVDDALVGSDTTSPYEASYDTGNTVRQAVIVAKAYDQAGNTGTATRNASIEGAGTITGVVVQHDGVTPVPQASVQLLINLETFKTAQTDQNGDFAFNSIPLRNYKITAGVCPQNDCQHPDRGSLQTALSVDGETRNVTVPLFGRGNVNVIAHYGDGRAVSGAQVTVTTGPEFTLNYQGSTAQDGSALISNVLAGAIQVRVEDSGTGLSGITQGSVVAGQTSSVTVQLGEGSTLQGTVLAANGVDPVSDGRLMLVRTYPQSPFLQRQTTTGADGHYLFELVPSGTYTLYLFDSANRLRNRVFNAVIGSNVTLDLNYIALGTVHGNVTRQQDGSVVVGADITLRSNNPVLSSTLSAITDQSGNYTIANVPAGNFTVSSLVEGPPRLYGEASSTIETEGEDKTVDLQLRSNAVRLPEDANLIDWNNFRFWIQRDGSHQTNGPISTGAVLEISPAGQEAWTPFDHSRTTADGEESNRELAITQEHLLSNLTVTRKVFVPTDGYFGRYLEILTNTSDTPLNVDVRVTETFNNTNMAVSQQTTNYIVTGSQAFLYQASGVPARALMNFHAGYGCGYPYFDCDSVSAVWPAVTIPANTTVILMHFESQQFHNAGAVASADRLSQLPPEALVGLSLDEIAQIRNFVVPPDGSSALPPLVVPQKNGNVTGKVMAADGVTAIPFATVTFSGSNPFYGAIAQGNSSNNGVYSITGVPVDAFSVSASTYLGGSNYAVSPSYPTIFGNGTNATQDITYSNTGMLAGRVFRHNGVEVTTGTVSISNSGNTLAITTSIGINGYLFPILPPGSYRATAEAGILDVFGSVDVNIVAGQKTVQDITIEPTGGLKGVVTANNNPVANLTVSVFKQGFQRQSTTDATGHYSFIDLPAGTLTVRAYTSQFGGASADVSILPDQFTTKDLVLGKGTVTVHVVYSSGSNASAGVSIFSISSRDTYNAPSDANGIAVLNNVPFGLFTASAFHPLLSYASGTANGSLDQGQSALVEVRLPAVATVRITALKPGIVPLPNAQIEIKDAFHNSFNPLGLTDAAGKAPDILVPEGSFTVRAMLVPYYPYYYTYVAVGTLTSNITASDNATTVDLALPIFAGTIRGHVFLQDGSTPLPNAYVHLWESTGTQVLTYVMTDSNGQYEFTNQPVDSAGFVLEAFFNNHTLRRSSAITSAGQTIENFDLVLPVSPGIKGKITFADGTRVPHPNVHLQFVDGSTFQATSTDQDGNYFILDTNTGDFNLTAEDPSSGLFAEVQGNRPDNSSTVTIDVTLPPAVAVTGQVLDDTGSPMSLIDVAFTSIGSGQEGQTKTDADGNFTFNAVGTGPALFQACTDPSGRGQQSWCGTANANLLADNNAIVNIHLPKLVNVSGTVYQGGDVPVPNVYVELQNLDHLGPLDYGCGVRCEGSPQRISNQTQTDSGGYYSGVAPAGRIRATAPLIRSIGNQSTGGTSDKVANDDVEIDLFEGTAPAQNCSSDGCFGYRLGQEGLNGNGSQNGLADLTVNRRDFGDGSSATLDTSGQQIGIGPSYAGGLYVTRKVFTPADDRFVRWLEIVKNPTDYPVSIPVSVHGYPPYSQLSVVPEDTGNKYAMWQNPDGSVLADVFGGNGEMQVSSTHFVEGSTYSYTWNLALGPRQTRALMHFVVRAADLNAAQTEVDKLLNLTEPAALEGLTNSERSYLANYNVPTFPAGIQGTITQSDGITPVSTPVVFATSTGGQTFWAASTDANGHYEFFDAPVGSFVLTAQDPATRISAQSAGYRQDDSAVVTINLSLPEAVAVTGQVLDQNGNPVWDGFHVAFTSISSGQENSTTTDSNGTFRFDNVPFGPVLFQACYGEAWCGTADSNLEASGPHSIVIRLPNTVYVHGTVLQTYGNPAQDAQVFVQNLDYLGPISSGQHTSIFNGTYDSYDLSAGRIKVAATALENCDQGCKETSGISEATVVNETEFTIDVTQGNATTDFTLESDIGPYGFGCNGSSAAGPMSDSPFSYLSTNTHDFGCSSPALLEAAGRQLSLGPLYRGGVHVIRKIYVPQDGSFVRWLEIVKNPTDSTITIPVLLHGNNGFTQLADNQNDYVIWQKTDGSALADVFGGTGALPLVVRNVTSSNYSYGWNLTLGPQQTRILVHFAVEAPGVATAHSKTEALRSLSPEALEGLTIEEQALVLNFDNPGLVRGSIFGTVKGSNNAPLQGAVVSVTQQGHIIDSTITDIQGQYRFDGLSAPPMNELIVAATLADVSAQIPVTFQSDGESVQTDLILPIKRNTIAGTVRSFDGAQPVPSAHVILSNASGDQIAEGFSAIDGTYEFRNLILPADFNEFIVAAELFQGSGFRVQMPGTIPQDGTPVTLDLHLPVTWITGHVFDSTGAPVSGMQVALLQGDPQGSLNFVYATPTQQDGVYTLVGAGMGPVTGEVDDSYSGEVKKVMDFSIPDLSNGLTQDIFLPQVATISGAITDTSGVPIVNARIGFSDLVTGATSAATADSQGNYSAQVPIGPFHAQVCEGSLHCTVTSGVNPLDGLTLDAQLPAQFSVSGSVPFPGTNVVVWDLSHIGIMGIPRSDIFQDNGSYETPVSDGSQLRVAAREDTEAMFIGAAEQNVIGDTTINVVASDVFDFDHNSRIDLSGTDGPSYQFDAGGELVRSSGCVFANSLFAIVNHDAGWNNIGLLEENRRQLILGPNFTYGIAAIRKIYVPEQGGFARYLEILENRTSSDLTIPVQIYGALNGDAPQVVASTDGSAVFDSPSAAVVFGGIQSPVAGSTVFWSGDRRFYYAWNITIPAGQTKILMHFAVQRSSSTEAQLQSEALRDLSDPNALVGLSDDEKSKIVNFQIPQ